jgi:hypothetical protein
MTPLFNRMPVEGDTTREPKIDKSVCVTEHKLPCRSTTLKWVVQGGAFGDSWSPMSFRRARNAASSERAMAR